LPVSIAMKGKEKS